MGVAVYAAETQSTPRGSHQLVSRVKSCTGVRTSSVFLTWSILMMRKKRSCGWYTTFTSVFVMKPLEFCAPTHGHDFKHVDINKTKHINEEHRLGMIVR